MRSDRLREVDWSRWSVVLLKPDCLRRGLADQVLARLEPPARIVERRRVVVEDWQIHVHYWDLLVDRDLFEVDVPACLRSTYVGRQVEVALAHGKPGTPGRLRGLLGHFDPTQAVPGTIRADLGTDSFAAARAQHRLVENLIHTSDHARAARRDFGTWFGAGQHQLLDLKEDHHR
ncbi:nucleoside-diphosphate kinase [Kitasatospora nipponensis]|uniref:nucleoside-diphosphate kinase n=1 Tax=Kitasatospora nipponensis TaxID=258049 RepID=A0ABP4GP70_9ACTN